jgi:hypothetical protein
VSRHDARHHHRALASGELVARVRLDVSGRNGAGEVGHGRGCNLHAHKEGSLGCGGYTSVAIALVLITANYGLLPAQAV